MHHRVQPAGGVEVQEERLGQRGDLRGVFDVHHENGGALANDTEWTPGSVCNRRSNSRYNAAAEAAVAAHFQAALQRILGLF